MGQNRSLGDPLLQAPPRAHRAGRRAGVAVHGRGDICPPALACVQYRNVFTTWAALMAAFRQLDPSTKRVRCDRQQSSRLPCHDGSECAWRRMERRPNLLLGGGRWRRVDPESHHRRRGGVRIQLHGLRECRLDLQRERAANRYCQRRQQRARFSLAVRGHAIHGRFGAAHSHPLSGTHWLDPARPSADRQWRSARVPSRCGCRADRAVLRRDDHFAKFLHRGQEPSSPRLRPRPSSAPRSQVSRGASRFSFSRWHRRWPTPPPTPPNGSAPPRPPSSKPSTASPPTPRAPHRHPV